MQTSPFVGELMGTLVLILLGNSVVANVVLKGTKGEKGGWIVITTGWALAVIMGIFTAKLFGSDDAHNNPAVTLAFAVIDNDYSNVLPYFVAQMIGGFLGGVLVWLNYLPHWKVTEDSDAKLGCFATGPAIRSTGANFLSETLGTLLLIICVAGIIKIGKGPSGPIPPGFTAYLVGMLVWSIGLSLGGTTGYAINPARDAGPRLAHALLPIPGKGSSDWSYAWIPVVGPMVGASLAALLLNLFSV
jgi:glycerol uptake facilitator protein